MRPIGLFLLCLCAALAAAPGVARAQTPDLLRAQEPARAVEAARHAQALREARRRRAEAALKAQRQIYCNQVGWQQGGTCLAPYPAPSADRKRPRGRHVVVRPRPAKVPRIHVPPAGAQGPHGLVGQPPDLRFHSQGPAPIQNPSHYGGFGPQR